MDAFGPRLIRREACDALSVTLDKSDEGRRPDHDVAADGPTEILLRSAYGCSGPVV